MQAIEFIADIENGTIKIPAQYHNTIKKCRVIILVEEKATKAKKSKKINFKATSIKTKDIIFNRNEIKKG